MITDPDPYLLTTDAHLWSLIGRYEKLCCQRSARLKAVLAVRLLLKALPQCFLAQRRPAEFFSSPAEIRGIRGESLVY
jgi:hypothetical protein